MKRFLTRALSLLLTVLMASTVLVACATPPQGDPNENDPDDNPSYNGPEEYAAYQIPDSLPDVTFGGRDFTILSYKDTGLKYYFVENKTGDMIDDAVWTALASTEERFDVHIGVNQAPAENEAAHITNIGIQVQGGLCDFDIANVHDVQGGNLSIQGHLLNVLEIEQFDFSKPWWSEKTVESLSYMDQLYLISSSLSYNSMGSTQVVFFNKKLMDDRQIEYPYQAVLDKEWYMEDMFETIEDLHVDVNSNEEKDAEDTFGVLIPREFYAIWESFGINMIEKSADGDELILNINNPRAYDLVEAFYDIIYERDGGYSDGREAKIIPMFAAGQGVYLMTSLKYAVERFRNTEFKYGIVPYPMLDEEQGEYYSGYTERFMVVPNTCMGDDRDFVGTIVESMSAEGYRQVLPAYYETALKGRYTHDDESVQMLEIIREARVFDFAYVYCNDKACTRGLYHLLSKKSFDYGSYYKEQEPPSQTRIEELEEFFGKMY